MAFQQGLDNDSQHPYSVFSIWSPQKVPEAVPQADVIDGIIQNSFSSLDIISRYGVRTYDEDGKCVSIGGLSIGNKKQIVLNGTVGTKNLSNYQCYAYIIGFDHNARVEGLGITFCIGLKDNVNIVFYDYNAQPITDGSKRFNINHWGSRMYGGWAGCDLRYDILGSTNVPPSGYGENAGGTRIGYNATPSCAINPVQGTLMSCIPADLRRVMKPITKYTDNYGRGAQTTVDIPLQDAVYPTAEFLPLMSEYEIFGTISRSNPMEKKFQEQYGYFIVNTNKKRYPHDNTSAVPAAWYTRSPSIVSAGPRSGSFCSVSGGNSGGSQTSTSISYPRSLSPIFLI